MSHPTYQIRQDIIFDEEKKAHLVFGIDLISRKGKKTHCFPDLFFDRKKAEDFASLCNEGNLSPIQFLEVLEDFLGT